MCIEHTKIDSHFTEKDVEDTTARAGAHLLECEQCLMALDYSKYCRKGQILQETAELVKTLVRLKSEH